MPRHAVLATGAIVFCLLALLNVGGYRYGVSDQAFYVPVVLHGLDSGLYPHDAPLLAAQSRFLAFDKWFAPLVQLTGLSVPSAFFLLFLASLGILYGAAISIGEALFRTPWAVAGLVIGLTLRHRIPDTAVNTLESYAHPRLLAFAVGLAATAAFLRGRTWLALAMVAGAFLIHPTTAVWFALWIGVAGLVADGKSRRPLAVVAAAATGAGMLLLAGPLRGRLTVMDPSWVAMLASKDYLFPTEWPLVTWLANLALAAIIVAVYRDRRALGVATEREGGLVAGSAVLLLVFLVSVPLAAAHVALAVQLQVSRIFWLLDIFATCYVIWFLIERPRRFRAGARPAIAMVLLMAALARGGYVMFVERAGHPLVQIQLVETDWNQVMRWAAARPVGTHFLVDPGHAWRYGTSVRLASGRDVYLEEIKDISIAIYSKAVADRVQRRLASLGDFTRLDADRARALAREYDLDYLVSEHVVDLPLAYQHGRFRVYQLDVDPLISS